MKVDKGSLSLNKQVFSDEAPIYVVSEPNKQKSGYGHQINPNFKFHLPLHSTKLTVWCGITASKINGTHFFEDMETGAAFTPT